MLDAVPASDRLDPVHRPCNSAGRVGLKAEGQREVEEKLRVGRAFDEGIQRRRDVKGEFALDARELANEPVVHPQPAAVPERVAVRLLHRRGGRRPDVSEDEARADRGGKLAQVAVAPGRLDAVEQRRCLTLSVPAKAEAVAVGHRRAHCRAQALRDQRVLRREQQAVDVDR